MAEINDKELMEQMEAIKAEAESVEIPEKVKPENMMKLIQEKKSQGYFEEKTKGINKKHRKGKRFSVITGAVATAVTAASLGIIIVGSGVLSGLEGNMSDKMVYGDYRDVIKENTGSDDDITTLSGYEQLKQYLMVDNTFRGNDYYYGDIDEYYGNIPEGDFEFTVENDMIAAENSGNSNAPSVNDDYSDTNTRTENVSEADIVKTDGKYIYYLTNYYGSSYYTNCYGYDRYMDPQSPVLLSIVKADGEDSETVSTIKLNDYIVNAVEGTENETYIKGVELMLYKDKLAALCRNGDNTVILIFDIADRSQPKLTDSLYVEGVYDSCKMVDEYLYIFAKHYIENCDDIDENSELDTEEAAKELLAPDSSEGKIPADDVYVSGSEHYNLYHMIATVDMEDTARFKQIKAVLAESSVGTIYVSSEHIYFISLFHDDVSNIVDDMADIENGTRVEMCDKSEIISLKYEMGEIIPEHRTVIDGDVGDEFSIDEYNGYLRVAVSTSQWESYCAYREMTYYNGNEWVKEDVLMEDYVLSEITEGSALYVLDEDLNIVGSIPQLKERERVYGVRFDGDIAYVVTYEQTDPLFSVDLSDPANPTVIGALKIPGFSTYLHKWDENTLIGIGYDQSGYVKVSTFDISDKTDVVERDICVVGGIYYSEALYNHKAVFVSPEKNLLGFIDENGVYRVLTYIDGELRQVIGQYMSTGAYQGSRGMYIGEYIYIVTPGEGIYVYNLNTFKPVTSVALETEISD